VSVHRVSVWMLVVALPACGDGDVLIGAHAIDAARTATDAPAASDAPATTDTSATTDVPPLPQACMTNPDCVAQCPRMSRGCVCAPTMMGLRCVPTCAVTPECPPAPNGMMLFCRMGLCVP
jgi:hypothetical protein